MRLEAGDHSHGRLCSSGTGTSELNHGWRWDARNVNRRIEEKRRSSWCSSCSRTLLTTAPRPSQYGLVVSVLISGDRKSSSHPPYPLPANPYIPSPSAQSNPPCPSTPVSSNSAPVSRSVSPGWPLGSLLVLSGMRESGGRRSSRGCSWGW